MTATTETRGLQAGRKLDALVAEKVFGYTVEEHGTLYVRRGKERGLRDLPDYSTDIGDAWLIVEKMRTEGCHVALETRLGGLGWSAWFGWKDRATDSESEANSPALALCRAALAAMESQR